MIDLSTRSVSFLQTWPDPDGPADIDQPGRTFLALLVSWLVALRIQLGPQPTVLC